MKREREEKEVTNKTEKRIDRAHGEVEREGEEWIDNPHKNKDLKEINTADKDTESKKGEEDDDDKDENRAEGHTHTEARKATKSRVRREERHRRTKQERKLGALMERGKEDDEEP